LNEYLNSANAAYRFNGVALVIRRNEVILNKGFGFSDMASRSPNTPDTRFPLLSITKTFTATIILKLQEEKKLSVNDDLSKYLPDYPNASRITIHQLLTHSSGIHNFTDDVSEKDSAIINHPVPKERVVNQFRDKALEFDPGKRFSYNNSGYFLLGLIIEKITGQTYESAVREYIFTPLSMSQSGFDFNGLQSAIKAQGYQFWNKAGVVPYHFYDSTFGYSTGAIYSTTNDMLKWARGVAAKEILTSSTWELAFKPRIQGYGYGWQTGQFFGRSYVKHSGGYPGYMSEFIYYPNENLTIVLLNNFGTYGQNIWSVGMGISSIVLGLPYDNWKLRNEVSVDTKTLQGHAGVYVNGKNKIEFRVKDKMLFISISGLPQMQVHPESENEFYLTDFNTSFHFEDDNLTVHEHGQDTHWRRKR
jgi:CubicO group peptidase (beta-lactamase class C family)